MFSNGEGLDVVYPGRSRDKSGEEKSSAGIGNEEYVREPLRSLGRRRPRARSRDWRRADDAVVEIFWENMPASYRGCTVYALYVRGTPLTLRRGPVRNSARWPSSGITDAEARSIGRGRNCQAGDEKQPARWEWGLTGRGRSRTRDRRLTKG
jgi:hypothetical protein